MRYVKDDAIKEFSSFCESLTTTTKAADMRKLVYDLLRENNISWDMVSAVCRDRALAVQRSKYSFAQACPQRKTLPPKLAKVLKVVEEYMNKMRKMLWSTESSRSCVKKLGLNSRHFFTLLTFRGYPEDRHWIGVFHACGISPVFARSATYVV